MKTIVLLGPSNSGKTTAMHLLFAKLQIHTEATIQQPVLMRQEGADRKDFCALLKVQKDLKLKKVLLWSVGDNIKCVDKGMDLAMDMQPDVYICAIQGAKPTEQTLLDYFKGKLLGNPIDVELPNASPTPKEINEKVDEIMSQI